MISPRSRCGPGFPPPSFITATRCFGTSWPRSPCDQTGLLSGRARALLECRALRGLTQSSAERHEHSDNLPPKLRITVDHRVVPAADHRFACHRVPLRYVGASSRSGVVACEYRREPEPRFVTRPPNISRPSTPRYRERLSLRPCFCAEPVIRERSSEIRGGGCPNCMSAACGQNKRRREDQRDDSTDSGCCDHRIFGTAMSQSPETVCRPPA